MSIDHIISGICNSTIGEVILIGDSTTLLDYGHQFIGSLHTMDYGHQFIGSLHTMDSRSWTLSSSHYYLHRILECS